MAAKPRSEQLQIHEVPSECGAAQPYRIVETESDEELLELAELYFKNGNEADARLSIDALITRLNTEFDRYKCNHQLFFQPSANEELKDAAEKYKQCCVFLVEKLQDQDRLKTLSCFYKGLILHGTSSLYNNDIGSTIWREIYKDFRKNSEEFLVTTSNLVKICSDLCNVKLRTRIVLFVAYEVMGKLLGLLKPCQQSKMCTELQQMIYTLLLTCARCHFYLEEYDKSIEALTRLWREPKNCKMQDVLVLWAWCLFHTEKFPESAGVAEHCMKLDVSEQQKTNLNSLLIQVQLKNVQIGTEQCSQESKTTFTTVSGYSYGEILDLVGSDNFEGDAFTDEWSDTESVSASEYSVVSESSRSSSTSISSRKRKVRRKTKILRKKKGLWVDESDTSSSSPLMLDTLNRNLTNKFDNIRKWNLENEKLRKHGRRRQKCSLTGLSLDDLQSETIYSRENPDFDGSQSDVTSVTSRTATSRANFSPDEFSGSDFDVFESDNDWYESGSDLDMESDEEFLREEPTFYSRSQSYHSGQFQPRNFLEKECFQKGLQLDPEYVEKLGAYYFKKRKTVYNDISKRNYDEQCQNEHTKHIYKKCSINIESAHLSVCKPLEPNDEIQEIEISGRSKCGMTFTDDTVVVQLYHNKNSSGKVHGEVKSLVERHRYKDIDHPVFVCLIDLKEGHLMKPLCRTVPKLHILHPKVIKNHKHLKKSRVEVYKYDNDLGTLSFLRYHDVKEGERENLLFIVVFLKWKENTIYPLAAVIDVIQSSQNPYDGIRIISKEHQVPYLYSKLGVDGVNSVLEAAKSFKTDKHNDKTDLRVFTIDPPGSKDLDDALSIQKLEDGSFIVGVHIADVSSLVLKDDSVDLEAKERCTTFYPGRGFRPHAMLPEPLSCDVFSLHPGKKKPVTSIFFKFEEKGRFSKEDPSIEKSIIKSCRQFTYQEVQDILDKKKTGVPGELQNDIQLLYKLSKQLKRGRLGYASLSLPVEIDISEEENPMETYQAHSLVEEFMILTNACIAKMLCGRYPTCVPLLCQPHPVNEVFDNWYEINKHYIHHVMGLQSMMTPEGEILVQNSPPEGRRRKLIPIQKWIFDEMVQLATEDEENMNICKIKELICSDFFHPKQALAFNEWLLFQESSKYVCSGNVLNDKEKSCHFSLRKNRYVHFTSPIRRYCDIVIHRLVTAMIKNLPSPYKTQEISNLCGRMNDATKRANQFKKDCKQFILGRYLQKHPILFNGFVKEMSDRGIRVLIPGLQKLSSTRKEIKFNTLDVGSKPQLSSDVDMLNMTDKEKERGMVVVKWEKRLYSYTHRSCRKPKPSRFDVDRQNFSPYLRIYPHQNTAFLRYREHWKEMLLYLLRGQDRHLKKFLTNFKDYDVHKIPQNNKQENNIANKEETDDTCHGNKEMSIVTTGANNEMNATLTSEAQQKNQNSKTKGADENMEAEITNKAVQEEKTNYNGQTGRSGIEYIYQRDQEHADLKTNTKMKETSSELDVDDIPLLPPLPEFTDGLDYNSNQRTYWLDKQTISSFKRSVTDVSSEVKQGIIVEHRCKFQVPYHHGQVVQVQLSADINRGFLTPKPQVLNVTNNVRFCIDHFDNPVKTLLRYAKNPTKDRYLSVEDYIKRWIPIIEMESTVGAVQSEDTAVINDIVIDFKGRRGRLKLTKGYCDIRDLDVNMSVVKPRKSSTLEMRESSSCHVEGNGEDFGEGIDQQGKGTRDENGRNNGDMLDKQECEVMDDAESVYSLCEDLQKDSLQNTDTIPNTKEEGSQHSSNYRKPEYTEILSSHFFCIKLLQPLPDNVKAKAGNCLPKNSQYFWVAHGSFIKSREIRTKKFSQRRGTEKKVLELDLVFKLHEKSPSPPVEKVTSDDKCSLELILKSKVFRRMECFIKLLPQASDLATHIAVRSPIADTDPDHRSLCGQVGYEIDVPGFPPNNQQQHIAIRKALRSKFSLIQGPPGTGKSFTGVKLIYLFTKLNKMFQEKNGHRRKLIFCGPSNKSVDLVARWVVNKLKDKAPKLVRMYASAYEYKDFPVPGRVPVSSRSLRDSKTDAELKEKGFVLHYIIRQDGKPNADKLQEYDAKFMADNEIIAQNEKLPHEERRPVETKLEDIYGYKKILNEATKEELEKYDVIFCTTSMAASPRLLEVTKGHVGQVIIDECGMCSEPESMVPIIATHASQVVLIGDHKQLRPIISCREAAELGLEKSLFERYSTDKQLMTMLEEQYRMHPSICEFPSNQFYEGKLKTAAGIGTSHQPLRMWPKIRKNHIPHVFCHIEGEEETLTVKTKEGNEQSRSNKKEVEQVLKVFKHMTEAEKVDPANINIMSQYNSQCTELRNALTNLKKERFNVTTVVSSQGGEWDYVIFSLVRSLPKYLIEKNSTEGWCIQNLGFITDKHQINVALTRARKGLVIIGNSNLLECDEVWKKLLEEYKKEDCYFQAKDFPRIRRSALNE